MRYPEFLKKNGTIGIVTPSFGAAIEPYRSCFDNAQKKWKEMGYKMDLGPNCYLGEGIGISNTPEKCGKELTDYYCSLKNDVLISCGGGELMCEILDYVDFEKIKSAKPKWFMGYSDNTNFTFLLTTLCDTASIYGPCVTPFGMEPWHDSIRSAFGLLHGVGAACDESDLPVDGRQRGTGKSVTDTDDTNAVSPKHIRLEGYDKWEKESLKTEEDPFVFYNLTETSALHLYQGKADKMDASTEEERSIHMEGRLLGGCVDCLVNLIGTQYDQVGQYIEKYKKDGILWFLEACDLNVMSIRRAMWEMEHAGWFNYTKGFIIGRPLHFGEEMMGLDQYKAVYDVVSKYRVPILMDADIGHLAPMVPLICGSMAKVEATQEHWSVDMQLV